MYNQLLLTKEGREEVCVCVCLHVPQSPDMVHWVNQRWSVLEFVALTSWKKQTWVDGWMDRGVDGGCVITFKLLYYHIRDIPTYLLCFLMLEVSGLGCT